jgi:hypothetical protein
VPGPSQRRQQGRWIGHGAEILDRVGDCVAGRDHHLEERKGEVDQHDAHQQPGEQDASGVLAAQAVAPHDPVRGPHRDQDESTVGHELDLWFETLNRDVGDEIVAGLEICGAEDEAEPHLEQQAHAVVQQSDDDLFRVREGPKEIDQLGEPDDEGLEVHAMLSGRLRSAPSSSGC